MPKYVDFRGSKSQIGKMFLKNPKLKPILLDYYKKKNGNNVDGEIGLGSKGDRIIAKHKKLTPEQRARAVMRNAKSPKQQAYARYLFSQLGLKE